MGTPRVSLPVSQLHLGRTTPPWNVVTWHGPVEQQWKVQRDADGLPSHVRVCVVPWRPVVASFRAVPHCFPARDVTLCYSVRMRQQHDKWGGGGTLPGLIIAGDPLPHLFVSSSSFLSTCSSGFSLDMMAGSGSGSGSEESPGVSDDPFVVSDDDSHCRVEWMRDGRAVVGLMDEQLFGNARLRLHATKWNDVALRVKLNSWDEWGNPRHDGIVALALNGRAAMQDGIVVCRDESQALRSIHMGVSTKQPSPKPSTTTSTKPSTTTGTKPSTTSTTTKDTVAAAAVATATVAAAAAAITVIDFAGVSVIP